MSDDPVVDYAYSRSIPSAAWDRSRSSEAPAPAPPKVDATPEAVAHPGGAPPEPTTMTNAGAYLGDAGVAQEGGTQDPPLTSGQAADEPGATQEAEQPAELPAEQSAEPTAQPAELTPEDRLKQADELLALVKSDPTAFAQKYGVDQFGPRFAELAKESARLREREQALKQGAADLQAAQDLLARVKSDPVGFANEHLGQQGYDQWTASILGQDKPEHKMIAALQKELADLKQRVGTEPVTPEFVAQQQASAIAANRFWDAFHGRLDAPEMKALDTIYGRDRLVTDALAITDHHLQLGQHLTGEQVAGMLFAEYQKRQQALGLPGTPQAGNSVTAVSPQSPGPSATKQGPQTLTSNLQGQASRLADTDGWDQLSEREQMARIAARYADR